MLIKLIHPKTNTIREVEESKQNKINLLERAGYVLFDTYKPPKRDIPEEKPSLVDQIKKNREEKGDQPKVNKPEPSIHVSSAAGRLIANFDLDPSLIEGTGKDGLITKPDVEKHLKELEEAAAENEAQGSDSEEDVEEVEEGIESPENEALDAPDASGDDDVAQDVDGELSAEEIEEMQDPEGKEETE